MFGIKIFIFVVAIVCVLFIGTALAQDSGPFDWTELGVNVGVIGSIIAVVQLLKRFIPDKFVVFAPMVLSAAAFFIMGGDQPTENVLYWAAAAGYLWKIANKLTPDNVLKSKAVLNGS